MAVEDDVLHEYFELLRFPSVGADPAHFKDCVDCASWLKRWLGALGFSGELLYSGAKGAPPTPPVLFAERAGGEGTGATVLVYGHYDVQPADPLGEWKTPPFEPTVKDTRVYCRGAQDDKGQTFAFLCGLRDVLADASVNVKILLDGEEESGSGSLVALLQDVAFRRRLAADVLLVCDTSAAPGLRPAIVAGLRGVSHFTVRLTAANRDLHSGEYGGIAPNAALGLARLLATLHAPDGAIAVPGFCDGIEPPGADEVRLAEEGARAAAAATKPEGDGSEEDPVARMYAEDIGCEPCGGQTGKSLVARNAFEPTIEVNGIHSGYGGPGAKTVIPCGAIAKISMRLVPGQSPRAAYAAACAHLEANCPRGMKVAFSEFNPGATGLRLPLSSPVFLVAEEVLTALDPRGPVFVWDGASIPVVSGIREASGAAPLLVGWGQAEDRIHSPNESYSFEQFERAREWARRILCAL